MKRFISILLVLVSLCAFSLPAYAEVSINSTNSLTLGTSFDAGVSSITSGTVNVRSTPNTSSGTTILGVLYSGSIKTFYTFTGVGTTAQQKEWVCVHWGNSYRYVCARYLGGGYASDFNGTVHVNGALNLRVSPSTNSNTICTLSNGTRVRVIDTTSVNGWYRITMYKGTGWVSSNILLSIKRSLDWLFK